MDNAATAIQSLLKTVGVKDGNKDDTVSPSSSSQTIDGKAGVKDTTVDETIAPAVTKEHVTKTHEEKVQHVVEKERHQDHYHTTIQPLKDAEVKPEEHDYKVAPVEEKEFNRDDGSAAEKANAREQAFTDSTTVSPTQETKTREETISGEHVHHHLHETIQPVIEKETIVPSVTHTTIPIKERYQEQSQDHGVTKNAPMSVDEFKAAGNDVSSKQEIHKEYAGTPKVNASKD